MSTRKVAGFGVLIALAFIFSYIESLIPISLGIPGIKLGFANIVVIIALYKMGPKEAVTLSLLRIFLVGMTFGNASMMLYSFGGAALSLLVMIGAKQIKLFSMVGVSILGGIMHNVGQIIIAIIVLESGVLVHYLPVLLIAGIVTGMVVGIMGAEIAKRLGGVM